MVEFGDENVSIQELHRRARRVANIIKEDGEAISRSVQTMGSNFKKGFKKLAKGNYEPTRESRIRGDAQAQVRGEGLIL